MKRLLFLAFAGVSILFPPGLFDAVAASPRIIPIANSNIRIVTGDVWSTTGVAVDPVADRVYISTGEGRYSDTGTVLVFDALDGDASDGNLLATIPVGQDCWSIALKPNQAKLYVVNLQGTVSVINTTTNTVATTFSVGSWSRDIAIDEQRNRAYVANAGSGSVSVIDTESDTVIGTIRNVGFCTGIALNPSTRRLYVPNFGDEVSVFDTTDDENTFGGVLTIPQITGQSSSTIDVAVSASKNRLFVTSSGSRSGAPVIERVTIFDIEDDANQRIGEPIPVGEAGGAGVREIAVDEGARKIYVTNVLDDTISILSANEAWDDFAIEKSLPVDPGAWRLAADTVNHIIYGTGTGPSFRFAVLADSRGKSCRPGDPHPQDPEDPQPDLAFIEACKACVNRPALEAVFGKIEEFAPDFVVFTGDMVLGRKGSLRVKGELEAWLDIIDEAVGTSDYGISHVLPVFGGHERNTKTCSNNRNQKCNKDADCGTSNTCSYEFATDAGPFWKAFSEVFDPKNDLASSGLQCEYFNASEVTGEVTGDKPLCAGADYGHTVYYCDFMDQARFFVLNNDCDPFLNTGDNCYSTGGKGEEIGPCQLAWLERHITTRPLNFLFHHEPAYGAWAHTSYPGPNTMDVKKGPRNDYVNLVGNHATMLFSGHEHQYTRRRINNAFANETINLETHLALFVVPGTDGKDGPRRAWSCEGSSAKAPILHIEWVQDGQSGTYHQTIASGKDDAEEGSDGSVDITSSSDLEMMKDGTDVQRVVGMRWLDVGIPRGAHVNDAYIQFTADDEGNQTAQTTINICSEFSGTSREFSTENGSLTARVNPGNCVPWENIPPWSANETGPDTTKEITDLVQNVVNRSDWGGLICFGGDFMEVKTGSCGAQWYNATKPPYNKPLERYCTAIYNDTYWTAWSSETDSTDKPWHFAIVDVVGPPGEVIVRTAVYAVTKNAGELVLIDRYPDAGIASSVKCDNRLESTSAAAQDSPDLAQTVSIGKDQVSGAVLLKTGSISERILDLDQSGKPDFDFLSGLGGLDIVNIDPGATVDLFMDFREPVPLDYAYFDAEGWTNIPFERAGGSNALKLSITDGGVGDRDREANGAIVHLGGVGAQKARLINDVVQFKPTLGETIDPKKLRRSTQLRRYRPRGAGPRPPRFAFTTDTDGCVPNRDYDLGYDPGFVGKIVYIPQLKNEDGRPYSDIMLKVKEVGNGNILRNADYTPGGVGAQLTVPYEGRYKDGLLGGNEAVSIFLEFCLRDEQPFWFSADVVGRPR